MYLRYYGGKLLDNLETPDRNGWVGALCSSSSVIPMLEIIINSQKRVPTGVINPTWNLSKPPFHLSNKGGEAPAAATAAAAASMQSLPAAIIAAIIAVTIAIAATRSLASLSYCAAVLQ